MTKPNNDKCPCHDDEEWNEERMNIIGQNGNEGTHYNYWTDVFDDGPLASSFPEGHGCDIVVNNGRG